MSSQNKINMTDKEQELFDKTQEGSYDDVKRLILDEKVNVNSLDDQGMTPLQQAAYRGNFELCKLLLDCGADVNSHHHISGYSTLTFGSLSGKIDVVSLLLEHGASTTTVNAVKRTAAQMASFVGNHHIVSIINNFIPKETIDYFTEPHGLEKEPLLPHLLSGPLHKLTVMTNIHPVRLALYLQSNILLLENVKNVVRILRTLSEKQLKDEANELLSLKFHHLSFVLNACDQYLKNVKLKEASANNSSKRDMLEPLIKCWIKGEGDKGFPIVLEKFLRQCVREFPYISSPLFQQLVHALAPIKIGDEPSAIYLLSQAVNGQRGINATIPCTTCGEPNADKKCSICHYVSYCDKKCQKLHWFTHKTICLNLKEIYEEEQKIFEENAAKNNEENETKNNEENKTVTDSSIDNSEESV